jgi:pimeloyl-ACP methyl ester carboxylesterase
VAELPPVLLPADGTQVVLYSRPGYGRSTPHAGRTVADAARDTAAIVDALDIDTFVTIGWSGGGPHALACAALLRARCTACAVIAGLAPYPAPVRDWTEGKAGVVLRGDDDELQTACDADRDAHSGLRGRDMATLFPAPADAGALTGAYADWLADVMRSAYLNGSSGQRDDWKAFVSDWGFDLGDARGVTLWQGRPGRHRHACARSMAEGSPSGLDRSFGVRRSPHLDRPPPPGGHRRPQPSCGSCALSFRLHRVVVFWRSATVISDPMEVAWQTSIS